MRTVDSHAHLQADAFAADAGEVAAAARLAGVERLMVPGWDLLSSQSGLALAEAVGALASAGIHPHAAASANERSWAAIERMCQDQRVRAVGETGLDYDRTLSPMEAQLDNLRRHLELGRRLGKPVILHCRSGAGRRDAQDDLLRELRAAGAGGERWPMPVGRPPALLHSFSGPLDYARQALELGLAISFSGLVFRGGEEASAEAAQLVPGDRLLVETDSPYLSPPGASRRRNEPQWVAITAAWLARQRDQPAEQLGEQLIANFDRIFGAGAA